MQKIHLPHVILPGEFIRLLKSNLPANTTSSVLFDVIRPFTATYLVLEKTFKEFDDGRGLEKTVNALGWQNFRDRVGSLYVYKAKYGHFPSVTDMDLVEDIKVIENRFVNNSIHGYSRLFLLGLYLKLANIKIKESGSQKFSEILIPDELESLLNLSRVNSEKIDWLILITMHLRQGLGDQVLLNHLIRGTKFQELYHLLSMDDKKDMLSNLLSYGASIQDQDFFLYDKV